MSLPMQLRDSFLNIGAATICSGCGSTSCIREKPKSDSINGAEDIAGRWKTCNREIALTCSYGQKTRRIMVSDARPGMTDEDVKTELHRGHAQGLGCP